MKKSTPTTGAETVMVDDRAVEQEIAAASVRPRSKAKAIRRKDPMAKLGLPQRYTAAGIRARNKALRAQGRMTKPGETTAKIVRDDWDKTIEARLDAANGTLEPWSSPDPLKEACDRIPNAGMRRRFLSEKVIQRQGMRGWDPVKDKRGDLVKVGTLFLGEMPEGRAVQRNRHYQEQSSALVREIDETHESAVSRIVSDGKKHGLTVLRPGEVLQGASADDFMNLGNPPRRSDAIGTQVTRGNSA